MHIIKLPSPNFSERKRNIDSIILHYTGMQSLDAALERMTDKQYEVSAHYCIARDGRIFQLVEDEKKAWHAGKSFWNGVEGLNDSSIGIEIENKGHEFGYENFLDVQMKSVIELCQNLIKKYNIKAPNILGHSDIAPERKEDPGEFFDWKLLAQKGIGLYHNIEFKSAEYENIRDIEIGELKKLREIGYNLETWKPRNLEIKNLNNTKFPNLQVSKFLITAFYRRFFPERILLSQNARYPENILWDEKTAQVLDAIYNSYTRC
ncbi:MAG TPA: N-acetylmuramoyl-L-alanine amidase [Alphaproteobacteria bacterium]|nr:N-acetylmuramoyl-L-alanine amidase [Alphaproteobacteria bacterium]